MRGAARRGGHEIRDVVDDVLRVRSMDAAGCNRALFPFYDADAVDDDRSIRGSPVCRFVAPLASRKMEDDRGCRE